MPPIRVGLLQHEMGALHAGNLRALEAEKPYIRRVTDLEKQSFNSFDAMRTGSMTSSSRTGTSTNRSIVIEEDPCRSGSK